MGAWICPTCRLHYGEEARQRCPADGATLVLNLSGASVQGHLLTHLLHVKPDGTTVWEAHAGPDERVALELLRGPQSPEAWAWAKGLDHPHIAAVKGFAPIDEDLACAVMAWIDGEPLSERLAQGPMPVPTALHLADQILDALAYVHGQDGVHGDLQPATIFVSKGTDAKLINVGVHRWPPLAEVLGSGGAKALDLSMVAYAAPERLAAGTAEPPGDLYSLSALLWHLITGSPIFGADPHACARAHLTAPRPSLGETFPDREWPEGLDAALARGLALRPEARFASADAMRAALKPIHTATRRPPAAMPVATDRPLAVSPMLIEPPIPADAPPARTWLWIAGVGVLLVGGVLIGNALRDDPRAPDEQAPRLSATSAPSQPAKDTVERVRATPLSAGPSVAPPSVAAAARGSIPAPASEAIASEAPPSASPASAAVASATPSAVAPASVASGPRVEPAAPASTAAAPVTEAPAIDLDPIQVASEPASPVAPPVVAKVRRPRRPADAPKAVAKAAERAPKRVARDSTPRRALTRKARKPRKTDRPVARAEARAPSTAALPTLGDKPALKPSVSKHGIRILGQ